MSAQQRSHTQNPTAGNRVWYLLISLLLLFLTLVPWFNDIAPGRTPTLFFNILPTPAVNILFALYVGAILLFGSMAFSWQSGIRQTWYRFWLALASLATLLIMSETLSAGWGVVAVGLALIMAAFSELVFLYSR